MHYRKLFGSLLGAGLLPLLALPQHTTGIITGTVKSGTGRPLTGITLKIVHEPTGTMYFSQSAKYGFFMTGNLEAGGPYSVEASALNFAKEKKTGIYVNLGESIPVDLLLTPASSYLGNVTVYSTGRNDPIYGTVIGQDKMDALPVSGSNLYEYLRLAPQAKLVSGNEGAVSFAGQNNRYNAFYIDGAVNNDVFGLAASGTNGGQAGISPVPIDAISQFQVSVSPYDASLGNFTGAGVNAVTRSGTNKPESSIYGFASNEWLTGKTPTGPKEEAQLLTSFSRKTYGFRLQGAITKNRFFYFMNIELQRDQYPQKFLFSDYRGNTTDKQVLTILANTLLGTYQYAAGNFLNNMSGVNAHRIVTRMDWNMGAGHRLSISSRYSHGIRNNTNAGNANAIHFGNDGFGFLTTSHSVTLELKSSSQKKSGNKLLITYTDVKDDRGPLGQPFPRVRINDGDGAVIFGTDNSSTINLLTQKNWTLFDKYHFITGKHALGLGIDCGYHAIVNAFIQNSFGNYTYASIGDFLTNARPSVYQLGFSLIDSDHTDQTKAAARFGLLTTGFFINDEVRVTGNLVGNIGLRIDQAYFLTTPYADDYTNRVALPAFAAYHELYGAGSGTRTKFIPGISPRLGFRYTIPHHAITLSGGMGIFTGRMPLAWAGGAYQNNGSFVGGYMAGNTQLAMIRFRPDPFNQWKPEQLGAVANKEPLNLTAARFRMPSLLRASLTMEKKYTNGWSVTGETMLSKNLQEIYYTNVNLLPPAEQSAGPDKRKVYSLANNGRIPLNADGSNPYDHAILLHNHPGKKGYAYDITATVTRQAPAGIRLTASYHFGHSIVVNEGSSSVNLTQWRSMETVNGRNDITRSVSDFSAGHQVSASAAKTYAHTGKKMATTFSLMYTGQSGNPVSYVYDNSMTRDDGPFGGYDLIYVPTEAELSGMRFVPNTVNGIVYTAQQQKEALESYIARNGYLRGRRGLYAERNGSRTPFTHVVDLKIRQDIRIKNGHDNYRIQLTLDLCNFTNFLNRNWGRRYTQAGDQVKAVAFAGYTSASDLTPQYRFDPGTGLSTPLTADAGASPAYSSRWNCRLGFRLTF